MRDLASYGFVGLWLCGVVALNGHGEGFWKAKEARGGVWRRVSQATSRAGTAPPPHLGPISCPFLSDSQLQRFLSALLGGALCSSLGFVTTERESRREPRPWGPGRLRSHLPVRAAGGAPGPLSTHAGAFQVASAKVA